MSCSERDVSGFGYSVGYSKGHFMIGSCLWPGALGGTRTPNLLIRSQMLYPLSYERRCRTVYGTQCTSCADLAIRWEHSG
jgi:hypothetical protein